MNSIEPRINRIILILNQVEFLYFLYQYFYKLGCFSKLGTYNEDVIILCQVTHTTNFDFKLNEVCFISCQCWFLLHSLFMFRDLVAKSWSPIKRGKEVVRGWGPCKLLSSLYQQY